MSKKKLYVVWSGRKKGIFTSWNVCKKQIDGFEGAQYKSFIDLKEAEIAFSKKYEDYKGKNTKKPTLSSAEKAAYGEPKFGKCFCRCRLCWKIQEKWSIEGF